MEKEGLLKPKEQSGEVGEQDQAQYDIFVANGMSIIYDKKTSSNFIDKIVNSPEPIEAIADATLSVVERLESSAASNNIQLQDVALIHGSNVLMGEIISLAEAAGLNPLTDEQKYQSFSFAVSKYLQKALKSGKITPEQLQQIGQEAAQTPDGQKIAQEMGFQQGASQASPQGVPQGVPQASQTGAQTPMPQGRTV